MAHFLDGRVLVRSNFCAHIFTNVLQQSFNPRPLIKYMEKLGVPYYFLDSDIFDVCSIYAEGNTNVILLFF